MHPSTRANYLASPPLVVAYSIAGTVLFDFETQSLGKGIDGQDVYLRDIWPSAADIQKVISECVLASMFKEVYRHITEGSSSWNELQVKESLLYEWDEKSTYVAQRIHASLSSLQLMLPRLVTHSLTHSLTHATSSFTLLSYAVTSTIRRTSRP